MYRLLALLFIATLHAADVTIRRDTYGIPHILASTEEGASFGLGYAQAEDHAEVIARHYVAARGEPNRAFGGSKDADFRILGYRNPAESLRLYRALPASYRKLIDAFTAGVNRYVSQHKADLPAWIPEFTGVDVIAFTRAGSLSGIRATEGEPDYDIGSNAFALHGSRTVSGYPILLGNPHLQWSAWYWEAQVTVPGKINFFGSTLPGIPVLRAGFNERLGWVTTNNAPDLVDTYNLKLDPAKTDHYFFGGKSLSLRKHEVTLGGETRTYWESGLGPIATRTATNAVAVRSASLDAVRYYEAFYLLSKTRNLKEFRRVLEMGLIPTSNFTYADADGNIFYAWNARIPKRLDDGTDYRKNVPAEPKYVWKKIHRFSELPQLLNPRGGYIMNSNDAPWYTNLQQPLDAKNYPSYFERGELRLRSQAILELIDNDRKFTVEDVWRAKFSSKVLDAERLKDDLVRAMPPSKAREVLAAWDNQVRPESRGAVLFLSFADRYVRATKTPFATVWDPKNPATTPKGIGDVKVALAAIEAAAESVKKQYGSEDVAWGDVHRYRFPGGIDLPAGGASGVYGVYRVQRFENTPDKKQAASPGAGFGDAWVISVEFSQPVKAWSVLAYGESGDPKSKHCCDQIGVFAGEKLRPVWFTEAEIRAHLEREYTP